MKTLLSNILKTFWQSKGMLHLIVGTAFIYDFMYWGATPHKEPQLVWNDMPATLYQLGWIKYFIYAFAIFCLAFLYEWMQKVVFNAIQQWGDVFWSKVGAPIAFILWAFIPESEILFYICLVICILQIVQFVYWLIKKYRK